jgi:hypothetical protein
VPKIRGIRPEFWTDEDVCEASIPARLLFIGLWNYACDNGHLQDKPKQIKARIFPADTVNCAELLRELDDLGLIECSDGWITVPNLARHQKPHKRWFVVCEKEGCEFPDGFTYGYSKRESPVVQPVTNGGTTVNNGGSTADVDVDGDVDIDGDSEGRVNATSRKRATKLPKDWKPTNDHLERALAAGLVLGREADKFRSHAEEKGRTAKNWNAAFTRWLMNAEDYASRNRAPQRHLQAADQIEEPPDGLNAEQYQAWSYDQAAKRKAARQ